MWQKASRNTHQYTPETVGLGCPDTSTSVCHCVAASREGQVECSEGGPGVELNAFDVCEDQGRHLSAPHLRADAGISLVRYAT